MKAIITLKADKHTKETAQKVARDLGLTLSAVVNASLKQFIRNREVYFSTAPRMTPYLEKITAQAEKDLKTGKNMSPVFSSDEEVDVYLNSL